MSINIEQIEKNIREIIIALGDNPDREGLKDTPKRVAKMYKEVFAGMEYSNQDLINLFNKTFTVDIDYEKSGGMVFLKDINIYSYCEHHMALMYDMYVSIAYIPKNKVIGLSKMARIADMVGKRLQLQENIGKDILEIMKGIIDVSDIVVLIQGKHSCMTSRGIKKSNSKTITVTCDGIFKENCSLLQNVLGLIK